MITSDDLLTLLHNDLNGCGLLFSSDSTAVFEAFYRTAGCEVFHELQVLRGAFEDGLLSACFSDPLTGEISHVAYRLGDSDLQWNGELYRLPPADSLAGLNVTLAFRIPKRITEHLYVGDDVLVLVRSNADDRKMSNRRMFVGDEDGTNMRELQVNSIVTYGNHGGARFVTNEGIFVAYSIDVLDGVSSWNGQKLFHTERDDFIIEERIDGSILVSLRW